MDDALPAATMAPFFEANVHSVDGSLESTMSEENIQDPVACGFLIYRGQPIREFLLMKHARRWDLPKGHVDPGETDLQCALRELREETGITADDIRVDADYVYESQYKVLGRRYGLGNRHVTKTTRFYLAELVRDVDLVITEHEGYQWFPWAPPHVIQKTAIDPLLAHVEEYFSDESNES